MIYNTYGSTGIKVSVIGFGGMRFPNQDDVDACASLVKAAYDAGINYFDTAIHYGKSEDLFGVAIKEMVKTRKQKPFYISTKTAQPDPAEVRRECETSLKRMGLDYIDFYHVWCVITPDAYRERKVKGAIKEFEKLKSEGLIKHICVSSHMTGSEITTMLNDPRITAALVGLSSKDQLAEAISAVDGFKPIVPEAVKKIRSSIKEAFNELCTGCRYCDSCPQGIPVPKLMDTYNQYLLSGKQKDMLDRLRWHWGIGLEDEYLTKCTQCGQCEKACTQKLPICDRLKFIRDEAQKALNAESQKK
jgi:predicted aldo/keto reductase-like oxidoreductase